MRFKIIALLLTLGMVSVAASAEQEFRYTLWPRIQLVRSLLRLRRPRPQG